MTLAALAISQLIIQKLEHCLHQECSIQTHATSKQMVSCPGFQVTVDGLSDAVRSDSDDWSNHHTLCVTITDHTRPWRKSVWAFATRLLRHKQLCVQLLLGPTPSVSSFYYFLNVLKRHFGKMMISIMSKVFLGVTFWTLITCGSITRSALYRLYQSHPLPPLIL